MGNFFPGDSEDCHLIEGAGGRSGTTKGADCQSIEVSGGTRITNGIYNRTQEYVESSLEEPVWKRQKYDRYIFKTESLDGFRIGKEDNFNNGKFYYASKDFFR